MKLISSNMIISGAALAFSIISYIIDDKKQRQYISEEVSRELNMRFPKEGETIIDVEPAE